MAEKIYNDSKIELSPAIAKHYDRIMNSISFGKYNRFIRRAVSDMQIQSNDHILDLGCGTGKNAALMAGYLGDEGRITGIDLSPVMEKQFLKKHGTDKRFDFKRERIDVPFDLEKKYDKVLISFVIHGFPHEARKTLLKNAYLHLKPGGKLMILDYSEFNLDEMPWHHRFILKSVECKYAFDYLEHDWKAILGDHGFTGFIEKLYFRGYTRLLTGEKNERLDRIATKEAARRMVKTAAKVVAKRLVQEATSVVVRRMFKVVTIAETVLILRRMVKMATKP
jgi:ubiquinone/menaquinone biosynthesis C-methylase UbiE